MIPHPEKITYYFLLTYLAVPASAKKSFASFKYDLVELTKGWRKKSTNWLILSVGDAFAEIIGLPGGGLARLCIFGNKYNFKVRGMKSVKYK